MATKPSSTPNIWASNAVYTTGPYVGMAGKMDPGVGIAAEGHRPGAADATAAEHENYQQNLVTTWVTEWLSRGSATNIVEAAIVERDVLGRTGLQGLDVDNDADSTAIIVVAPNTLAPLVSATSTGGGQIYHASMTSTSGGMSCTMVGAASGNAFDVTATTTSAGRCFSADIPSGSASPGIIVRNAANTYTGNFESTFNGGPGVVMSSNGGPCLTLDAQGPFATPLVLVPRNLSTIAAGSFWIDNTTVKSPMFYDASLVQRTCWASVSGMLLASAFTAGPTTFSVAQPSVCSVSVDVVNGQRYLITMGVDVGRGNGTTPDIVVTATAGAATLPFSGFTIKTFETTAVANQTERGWTKSCVFTATSTGNITIALGLTPSPLANATYAQAFVTVMGHYV